MLNPLDERVSIKDLIALKIEDAILEKNIYLKANFHQNMNYPRCLV